MIKNNSKATIREVYTLLEDVREELNNRIDNLENNSLQHLSDRIANLEMRVWMGIGILAAISLILRFLIK